MALSQSALSPDTRRALSDISNSPPKVLHESFTKPLSNSNNSRRAANLLSQRNQTSEETPLPNGSGIEEGTLDGGEWDVSSVNSSSTLLDFEDSSIAEERDAFEAELLPSLHENGRRSAKTSRKKGDRRRSMLFQAILNSDSDKYANDIEKKGCYLFFYS